MRRTDAVRFPPDALPGFVAVEQEEILISPGSVADGSPQCFARTALTFETERNDRGAYVRCKTLLSGYRADSAWLGQPRT
jgi:hypothetical protein